MTLAAATTTALEQQIAKQRELAEQAMEQARRTRNPREIRRLKDKARGHYSMMTGLISRRSDERESPA